MKTITIDISDQVYERVRDFFDLLPGDSIRVYDDDPDVITLNEKDEIYAIRRKIEHGDWSDFKDWEEVKNME